MFKQINGLLFCSSMYLTPKNDKTVSKMTQNMVKIALSRNGLFLKNKTILNRKSNVTNGSKFEIRS